MASLEVQWHEIEHDHGWDGATREGKNGGNTSGDLFRMALIAVDLRGLKTIRVTSLCWNRYWCACVVCA